jgi:multiple sugar transport system substrate-binding protein
MSKGKFFGFVVLLLSLAVLAWAAPVKITVLTEGFIGGVGKTIDDSIAGLMNDFKNAEDADQRAQALFKIDYLSALNKVLKPQEISVEVQDWGWAEDLVKKEVNAFLAKQGPEVIVGETQMPGFAVKGYLQEFPAALTTKVKNEVQQGAYLPLTVGGKIYGMAVFPGVSILLWNKDVVKKAGLNPEKAPATWDELLANADAVTKAGKGQFYGGGCYAGPHFGGSLRYGAWLLENGGGFVDAGSRPAFNSPANIETLTYVRKLAKNIPPGLAGEPNEGAFWDAFHQGKMAYIIDGPWRKSEAKRFGVEVGYSGLPMPKGKTQPFVITIGAAFYGVPTYAKNKDAAFKYLEALLDKSVQDVVVKDGRRPPVLKLYQKDPDFMGSYMGAFYKALGGSAQGLPTFAGEQNAKIWDILHQAGTKAIVTDGDIKQIMDEAQRTAAALK